MAANIVIPPPEPRIPLLIKQGFLTKVSGSPRARGLLTPFQRRWFVLTDENISYFKTEKTPDPQGVIPLSDITAVVDSTLDKANKKDRGAFDVITARRTYTVMGETAVNSSSWREAILAAKALGHQSQLPAMMSFVPGESGSSGSYSGKNSVRASTTDQFSSVGSAGSTGSAKGGGGGGGDTRAMSMHSYSGPSTSGSDGVSSARPISTSARPGSSTPTTTSPPGSMSRNVTADGIVPSAAVLRVDDQAPTPKGSRPLTFYEQGTISPASSARAPNRATAVGVFSTDEGAPPSLPPRGGASTSTAVGGGSGGGPATMGLATTTTSSGGGGGGGSGGTLRKGVPPRSSVVPVKPSVRPSPLTSVTLVSNEGGSSGGATGLEVPVTAVSLQTPAMTGLALQLLNFVQDVTHLPLTGRLCGPQNDFADGSVLVGLFNALFPAEEPLTTGAPVIEALARVDAAGLLPFHEEHRWTPTSIMNGEAITILMFLVSVYLQIPENVPGELPERVSYTVEQKGAGEVTRLLTFSRSTMSKPALYITVYRTYRADLAPTPLQLDARPVFLGRSDKKLAESAEAYGRGATAVVIDPECLSLSGVHAMIKFDLRNRTYNLYNISKNNTEICVLTSVTTKKVFSFMSDHETLVPNFIAKMGEVEVRVNRIDGVHTSDKDADRGETEEQKLSTLLATSLILKVVAGPSLGLVKVIRYPETECSIGRAHKDANPQSSLLIDDDQKTMSRNHCEVALDYGRRQYYLTDKSSTGTAVCAQPSSNIFNSAECDFDALQWNRLVSGTSEHIRPGDLIRCGKALVIAVLHTGGAPTLTGPPKASHVTGRTISLVWPPATSVSGGPIFGYRLQLAGPDGVWIRDVYKGSSECAMVEDLHPATEYSFRLCARDGGGESGWSAPVVISTAEGQEEDLTAW